MRYTHRGLLLAGLLLTQGPFAASAQDGAATNADDAGPQSPFVGRMVEDEAYRRDGAITNMPTCLAVADDPDAARLWNGGPAGSSAPSADGADGADGPPPGAAVGLIRMAEEINRALASDLRLAKQDRPVWRTAADAEIAARLAEAGPAVRHQPGFGTLIACAQIVAAWQGTLPDRTGQQPPDDGRLEHGAVVLDLQIDGADERATIAAPPLIRLLSSPHLLPPAAFGGLVLRNAEIEGALLFYNLHLDRPLALVNVTFGGGGYSKAVFQQGDIEGAAISIQHSRFNDYLTIQDSRICGDVLIRDSEFQETLQLSNVIQPEDAACGGEDPKLELQATRFDQSLTISRSEFGRLFAVSNDIQSFLLSRNQFRTHFQVQSNAISNFEIYGAAFARHVSVKYNQIAGDFFINYSVSDRAGPQVATIETLEINSNRIGGGLGLVDFAPRILPVELDFRSNRVGNGSEFCLPPPWRGELLLHGSTYEGTLAIGLAELELDPAPIALPIMADKGAPGSRAAATAAPQPGTEIKRDPPCYGPYFVETSRSEGRYCAPREQATGMAAADQGRVPIDTSGRSLALVDLEATRIRTLRWHMPLHCTYRWSGFGLTYELWDAPAQARNTFIRQHDKWREAAFNTWRTTLVSHDPAALDAMSRYFADKGAYVASRNILLEAKRLNYAPACPPDESIGACLVRVFQAPSLIKDVQAATDDVTDAWFESWGERALRAFKLVLLWPGGYGAQPERALILLIGGVFAFAALYFVYVGGVWRRYARLDGWLVRLQELLHAPPGGGQAPAREAPGRQPRPLLEAIRDIRLLQKQGDHTVVTTALRRRLVPELEKLPAGGPEFDRLRRQIVRLARDAGSTQVHGFSQFNSGQMPTRFTPIRYSIDAMVPVIDLHAYSNYYPEWWVMRGVTVFQHVLGWWWLSVFVASAAIL